MAEVHEGKLLPLAVHTPKRTSALPDVPTTLEAGFADSDYNFWMGMLVPAKTPREYKEFRPKFRQINHHDRSWLNRGLWLIRAVLTSQTYLAFGASRRARRRT